MNSNRMALSIEKYYKEVPPKVEYSLTEFGDELGAYSHPDCDWGEHYMEHIQARIGSSILPVTEPSSS